METLVDRYQKKISGVLTCADRVVITGTLPELSNNKSMTSYLFTHGIRVFDYPKFAEPFRNQLRENAEQLAKENQIAIEFVRKSETRKETIISELLAKRGLHPGLVHILSAMETCPTYEPWHNKTTGKTYLKCSVSKCLTYYFYFIDELLGLCYVRVPTWLPFRLQIYFNGHNWLASKLKEEQLKYKMLDNAFVEIDNWERANSIVESFKVEELHEKLNRFASKYCPVYKEFKQLYHWSIMQCEYATDIVFKEAKDLQAIYSKLIQTAVHTVKPEHITTFLGKKLSPLYTGEIGNQYHVRIEGTCIKHIMGKVSIKMYDKFGHILRIETTTNDVSFFRHYREVIHRDGSRTEKDAAMKKNIYSLTALLPIMKASNRRYLEFISAIEDDKVGKEKLEKITQKVTVQNRNYAGFNFFSKEDEQLLQIIARGEFNISGFRAKHLKKFTQKSSSQISRILKRLHVHGLIKKVRNSYKYYLTTLGKEAILLGEKLISLVLIPQLNHCKI
jgi:DNA-binding MarR family transcriptional regulator